MSNEEINYIANYSICASVSNKRNAGVICKASCLFFGQSVHQHQYFVYASNQCIESPDPLLLTDAISISYSDPFRSRSSMLCNGHILSDLN